MIGITILNKIIMAELTPELKSIIAYDVKEIIADYKKLLTTAIDVINELFPDTDIIKWKDIENKVDTYCHKFNRWKGFYEHLYFMLYNTSKALRNEDFIVDKNELIDFISVLLNADQEFYKALEEFNRKSLTAIWAEDWDLIDEANQIWYKARIELFAKSKFHVNENWFSWKAGKYEKAAKELTNEAFDYCGWKISQMA